MKSIRMVHDSEAPPYIDPAFAADCHGALDALLAKGVISITFIGEDADVLNEGVHLESHPPSFNLQIGALLRAKIQFVDSLCRTGDE
jgi:hypothetical protein